MLNLILAVKFVTIFAQTNLLYYELEKIPITRRRKIIETVIISVVSTASIALIGNFSLSPLVGLVLIAVISIYHSRTKHQTIIASIFCIFSLYAVTTVLSALAGDVIMIACYFIMSGYHKEITAVCAIIPHIVTFLVIVKLCFPKSSKEVFRKRFSKRFSMISSGIFISLYLMIAVVKMNHEILANNAEFIIVIFSIIVVTIATIKMAETKEDELNKELERREAVTGTTRRKIFSHLLR